MLPNFWRWNLVCNPACAVSKCCLTALRQCHQKGFRRPPTVWPAIPSVNQIVPACVQWACICLVCLPLRSVTDLCAVPGWSGLLLELWLLAWSTAWEPRSPIMMDWLTCSEKRIWPTVRWRRTSGCEICCELFCSGCLLDPRRAVLDGVDFFYQGWFFTVLDYMNELTDYDCVSKPRNN